MLEYIRQPAKGNGTTPRTSENVDAVHIGETVLCRDKSDSGSKSAVEPADEASKSLDPCALPGAEDPGFVTAPEHLKRAFDEQPGSLCARLLCKSDPTKP